MIDVTVLYRTYRLIVSCTLYVRREYYFNDEYLSVPGAFDSMVSIQKRSHSLSLVTLKNIIRIDSIAF